MNKLYLEIDISKNGVNILKKILYERKVFPIFFENIEKDKTIIGYGDKNSSEYLFITIDFKACEVLVERDVKSTLVLYYKFLKNKLVISSEISDFANGLTKSEVNVDHILFMLSQGYSTSTTVIKDVFVMYPERKYIFREDFSSIEKIPSDFEKLVDITELPNRVFKDYTSENIGFEISGGKDSSFLPFLCKHTDFEGKLKKAFGLKLNDEAGRIQMETIEGITDYLGMEKLYFPLKDSDFPFLKLDDYIFPFNLNEENYFSSFLGEVELLKIHGVDTVFNGIGGDEMFMIVGGFEKSKDDCIIFNDKYRSEVENLEVTEDSSTSFSSSVYDAIVAKNAIYTRRGIWQVTPFLDKAVYDFFRGLGTSKKYFYDYYFDIFGSEVLNLFSNNQNFRSYFYKYAESSFFKESVMKLKDFELINQYLDWEKVEEVLADVSRSEESSALKYKIYLCLKIYFSLSNIR